MQNKNIFPEDELALYYKEAAKFIRTMVDFSREEEETLPLLFKPEKLKRGSHFIREGEICNKIAYVNKGIFRFYHVKDGSEITSDFLFKGTFIAAYLSLITREPSDTSVQALEDSVLLVIPYEKMVKQYNKGHKFERIGRLMAENTFISGRKHLLSLLNDTAEKRYLNLIKREPRLVQRIPLHYIASYLGISPETLSRIRKKLSIS